MSPPPTSFFYLESTDQNQRTAAAMTRGLRKVSVMIWTGVERGIKGGGGAGWPGCSCSQGVQSVSQSVSRVNFRWTTDGLKKERKKERIDS